MKTLIKAIMIFSCLMTAGCTRITGEEKEELLKENQIHVHIKDEHGSFYMEEKSIGDLRIVFVDNHRNFNWEVLYGMFEAAGVNVFFEDNAEFDVSEYDALVLGGGYDIDPSFYGEPNMGSEDIDIQEDEIQLKAAEIFINEKKPVLGICRGAQLLNVYFGGTLIQDMPNHRGSERTVQLRDGSFFLDSIGEKVTVSCWHHQAVKHPGDELVVTMYDSEDLTIEGFEHRYLPVYGIQWHPEGSDCGRKVIETFLQKVLEETNRRK